MSGSQILQANLRNIISQLETLAASSCPAPPHTPPDSPVVPKAALDAAIASLEQTRQELESELKHVHKQLATAEEKIVRATQQRSEHEAKRKEESARQVAAAEANNDADMLRYKKSMANLKQLIRDRDEEIFKLEAEVRALEAQEKKLKEHLHEVEVKHLEQKSEHVAELLRSSGQEKQALIAAHQQELSSLGNEANCRVEEARKKHRVIESELQQTQVRLEQQGEEAQTQIQALESQITSSQQESRAQTDAALLREAELEAKIKAIKQERDADRADFDQRIAHLRAESALENASLKDTLEKYSIMDTDGWKFCRSRGSSETPFSITAKAAWSVLQRGGR